MSTLQLIFFVVLFDQWSDLIYTIPLHCSIVYCKRDQNKSNQQTSISDASCPSKKHMIRYTNICKERGIKTSTIEDMSSI